MIILHLTLHSQENLQFILEAELFWYMKETTESERKSKANEIWNRFVKLNAEEGTEFMSRFFLPMPNQL